MRSSLIALPFLSFLIFVIGLAIYSTLPTLPFLAYILWALAAALLIGWGYVEKKQIKLALTQKNARHGFSSGLSFILSISLIVGLAFISSRPRFNLSWDVTQENLNTLSDQSMKLIEKMNQDNVELEVLGFFVDPLKKQNFADMIALYRRAGAKISLKYIDPQVDPTLAIAENISSEDTVIVKNGPQESRITTFTEERMTNAFLNVLKTESKSIYFTVGHGENDINSHEAEGFQLAKAELESERYEVQTVQLLEHDKIPESVDLLVIAGPRYDFRPEEIELLRNYLNEGRPLLVLVNALVAIPNLQKLLEEYGLSIQNDLVAINPGIALASQPGWQFSALVDEFDEFSPVTRDFVSQGMAALVMPYSRSIDVIESNDKGMRPSILGRASQVNIRYHDVSKPDDMRTISQDQVLPGDVGLLAYSVGQVGGSGLAQNNKAENSEEKSDAKNDPLEEAQLNRELRLVVVGSSHLASNYGAQRPENLNMFLNLANYLLQDEDFISIRPKESSRSRLELSSGGSLFNLYFFSWIYPWFFLGYGVVNWLKRRRM